MTTLREKVDQWGLRIRSGAERLWIWWGLALLAWLPLRWRNLLCLSDARLIIAPAGSYVDLIRMEDGYCLQLATLPLPVTPEAVNKALQSRDTNLPLIALLPVTSALRRQLRLPVAAEGHLRDVLRFEIDRQTPFTAAQVYFDTRLVKRQHDGQLDIDILVAPRQDVDTLLLPSEVWHRQLDGVDVADQAGTPLGVNLLPPSLRRRRRDPVQRLNLLLLLIVLIVLLMAAWQYLGNRKGAAEQLSVRIEGNAVRARAAAMQRQQLQDLVDGQAFFDQQRASRPSITQIINTLSQRLGDDTWLEKFSIEGHRLQLIGFSNSASSLVPMLEGAELWKTPSLTSVLRANGDSRGEYFTLDADLHASVTTKEVGDDTAADEP